jgi:hypothetical protein
MNMKKFLYTTCLLLFLTNLSCFSQQIINDQTLFSWSNGKVVEKEAFLPLLQRVSQQFFQYYYSISTTYYSYTCSSANGAYRCNIQLSGTSPQMQNNRYEIINLFREGDGGGSIGWYLNEPLTTTQWLSGDENDTHFFRKIDLDDNSYALIFAGWFFNQGPPGEMIIFVISKNVASIVYHDYAYAITPTDFDSDSFSMDFVKDLSRLIDPTTEDVSLTPARLARTTKYTLYKDGNNLRIKEWR